MPLLDYCENTFWSYAKDHPVSSVIFSILAFLGLLLLIFLIGSFIVGAVAINKVTSNPNLAKTIEEMKNIGLYK